MRSIITILLLISLSLPAYAIHLVCYSGGKVIYKGDFAEVYTGEGYVMVQRKGYSDIINANCIGSIKDHPKKRSRKH